MPIQISQPLPRVSLVRLCRPSKRNALNAELLEALIQAIEQQGDKRVILLAAEGPVFCAGLDLTEETALLTPLMGQLLTALSSSPAVTIAVVQGPAVAGGAGLVAACDLAVATEEAHFAFPETRKGLVAAQVMACLLRKVAPGYVKELLLLGESVNALRAYEMGLINAIAEDPLSQALAWSEAISKGAPGATRLTKELLMEMHPTPFAEDLAQAAVAFHKACTSKEAEEGKRAFLEKREPDWR